MRLLGSVCVKCKLNLIKNQFDLVLYILKDKLKKTFKINSFLEWNR